MRFHFFALILTSTFVLPAGAQNWPGRSARLVTAGVEVLDSATAIPRRVFYDSTSWGANDPSISPDGALLGVVRMQKGIIEGTGYGVPPFPTTVVVDARTGAERLRIPRGYAFAWCGNDCLAVIYGVYSEDSEMGPYGDSAAVFTVSTRERRFVWRGSQFFAPYWSTHDSTLLFGVYDHVRRFDLRSGYELDAQLQSVHLSGSGHFAIERGYGEDARVTKNAEPLIPPVDFSKNRWQVEEWLGRTDKVLLLRLPPPSPPARIEGGLRRVPSPRPPENPARPGERFFHVWDVATGTVSEEWSAAETQWRGPAPGGCRLFLKDGRLTAAPGCR